MNGLLSRRRPENAAALPDELWPLEAIVDVVTTTLGGLAGHTPTPCARGFPCEPRRVWATASRFAGFAGDELVEQYETAGG